MKFKPGDVIRIAYKWPHEMKNPDGQKDRPAVVVAAQGDRYFVSPMTTKAPDKDAQPHAIPVKANLQRQLGLSDEKPSWVYPHHVNIVDLPSSSVHMTARRGEAPKWTHGTIPPGMLKLIDDRRLAAIGLDQHKIQKIASENLEQTREVLRSGREASSARSAPGPGRDRSGLQAGIRQRAVERHDRKAQEQQPKNRRPGYIHAAE